jgi:hypothetical protein
MNTDVLIGNGLFAIVAVRLFVGAVQPAGSVRVKVVSTFTLFAGPLLWRFADAATKNETPVGPALGEKGAAD